MNKGIWIWVLCIFASCAGRQDRDAPQSLSHEARLLHFWDEVDFQDTVTLFNPEIGEQQLVDFLALLPKVSDTVATKAIEKMLRKAEDEDAAFDYYTELYRHYLADPNSPMRSDVYYQSVLTYLIASPKTSAEDKIRFKTLLPLLRLNSPGNPSTDFDYLNTKGEMDHLYGSNSAFTLLVFYDPTCPTCKAVFKRLAQIELINTLLQEGELQALAVSVVPDKALWVDNEPPVPETWTIGLDEQGTIIEHSLYHITAFPTLYLLDLEKNVIIKDGNLNEVLNPLRNAYGH